MTLTKEKLAKFFQVSEELIYLLIIFLVPLTFSLSIYNHWQMAKNIVFQSLVEILFFLFLSQVIIFGLPKEKIKKSLKFILPAFIFILSLLIATIFSPVKWMSFWGEWQRKMGLLTWVHFFVFYCIFVLLDKNKAQLKRIFLVVVFTLFLVNLYGFIQFFRYDPFSWNLELPVLKVLDYRVFSTLGQPNFLASWLILTIPFLIICLVHSHKFLVRYLLFILIFSSLVILILTQSRGGLIGFFSSLFFCLFCFGLFKLKKKIIPLIFIIVLLVVLFVLSTSSLNFTLGNRLISLSDIKSAAGYRLHYWLASLEVIKKRPLIGYGLDSQRYYLTPYYTKELALLDKPNLFLDRAHNNILDVLLTSGIIGLLCWWAFVISIFYWGIKFIVNTGKYKKEVIFILSGIFGYLISTLFSFHTHSPLLYFWLSCGLISHLVITQKTKNTHYSKERKPLNPPFVYLFIIALFLILGIFVVWLINGYQYLASHYLLKSKTSLIEFQLDKAYDFALKSVKYGRKDPYFKQMFGETMFQASQLEPQTNKRIFFVSQGIEQIQSIPKTLRPIEAKINLPLLLMERIRLTGNDNDKQYAENLYQELTSYVPQCSLVWSQWAELELVLKNYDQAIQKAEKAISLLPDYTKSLYPDVVIEEIVFANDRLARAYFQKGNVEKALDIYFKALKIAPRTPFIWQRIALIYQSQGQTKKAAQAIKQKEKFENY